jgi:hypothetical protein
MVEASERTTLDKNPYKKYCTIVDRTVRARGKKRKTKGTPPALPFDAGAAKVECIEWLELIKSDLPNCYDHMNKRALSCTCLSAVSSEHVATFMVDLASQPKKVRQTVQKGIISGESAITKSGKAVAQEGHDTNEFKRPYRLTLTKTEDVSLCMHGFRNLLVLRQDAWKTIQGSAKAGQTGPTPHKNLGNKYRARNSKIEEARPALSAYFKEIGKMRGEPYATRFVREITGIGVRDAQVDVVELPSSSTQRDMYKEFCYQQGYTVKASAKGDYGKLSDLELRTHDDEWTEDDEPGPVCDWRCFRDFWEESFAFIRIRPQSEDTCGECYIYKNRAKYKQPVPEDDSDDEGLSEEQWEEKAFAHVEQAACQRKNIIDRTTNATADANDDVPHHERRFMIIIDYAQNVCEPHFGEEQPGATFYYTPKNIFIFGVTDLTVTPSQLYAYAYEEETGRKGGNNVASLIMLHLRERGMLHESATGEPLPGKLLTIAADNCSGQNKNNHVLRLANYLVEKGYFLKVEVLFYVRGHTKNACDRHFNLLKLHFHKNNIYTFNSDLEPGNLVNMLRRQKDTTVIPVTVAMFHDWHRHLNRLYKLLESGTILINHVFEVSTEAGATFMLTKEDCDCPGLLQDIKKKGVRQAKRKLILQEKYPVYTLAGPGLAMIKRVDLWKNYRPWIPQHLRHIVCPRPPEAEIEEIAKKRQAKAKKRLSKQKRDKERQEAQLTATATPGETT